MLSPLRQLSRPPPAVTARAVTLLELLITIAIISLLAGIMVPSLSAARREAMSTTCGTQLRELGSALAMYADDYDGRLMPLAYFSLETIGTGPPVYWWGTNDRRGVDHRRGFLWPYLRVGLDGPTVFACPRQPWGSYKPQGAAKAITSTYGYNGYYLCPPHTPGHYIAIGHMEWLTTTRIQDPSRVFTFTDTLIDLGGSRPMNNALIDPPHLFTENAWTPNPNPTTSFRHDGRTMAMHADGHADRYRAEPDGLASPRHAIGSVGLENGPHYVPNWRSWRTPPR
jgi:prepilin-type N-terminal cleavage/methylation domain-containing protein/prepilin-type processing-associated H-X9-DG protein